MSARAEEAQRWGIAFVVIVTLWRVAMHGFNATELFVDEAQYWAWSQNLDWGYFSKPPMIGFLLRAVTDLAGSDAAFWVRSPAPVLHGITALLILAIGRQAYDGWVGAWAAAIYVSMPLIGVGSQLMSTDTVMLPFLALATWMFLRLTERASVQDAAVMGIALGCALLSKYAAIYFFLGWALVAMFQPSMRLGLRDSAIAVLLALVVFSPNILWNIANDATTVRHVVEDNAKWDGTRLFPLQSVEFLVSQAVAFGPVLLVVLFAQMVPAVAGRLRGMGMTLFLLSVPVILIVTGQALLSRAFGNWAAAAYIAAPVLVAATLQMHRGWLVFSVGLASVTVLAFPLAFAFPSGPTRILTDRYVGMQDVTNWAEAQTKQAGFGAIVASERALLADLTYRLNDTGLQVRSVQSAQAPHNYYEQTFPIGSGDGTVVYLGQKPLPNWTRLRKCEGAVVLAQFQGNRGRSKGKQYFLTQAPATCLIEPVQ